MIARAELPCPAIIKIIIPGYHFHNFVSGKFSPNLAFATIPELV